MYAHASATSDDKHPLHVVCVESVWCNIASQIGGDHVRVESIISTPGIDPHEFSPTPAMARLLAQADFAIMNGGTYDDWAVPFVAQAAQHVNVAEHVGWVPGADAHVFLDPHAVGLMARVITQHLQEREPANAAIYAAGLAAFLKELEQVQGRLRLLQEGHAHQVYAATETQGTVLFHQAGLQLMDVRYAQAVAQHTGPSPRDEAALEEAIQVHNVAFLVVNPAVQAPQIERLESLARAGGIPVLHVGETLPLGMSWQGWVTQILDQTDKALNASRF